MKLMTGRRELFGDPHAAKRLAIALGMGHAEVAADAFLGAAALAVADDHDFFVAEARHAAGHRLVVAKGAIPVNLAEIGEDPLDEVHGVGPLGVTRPLDSDPGRRNCLRLMGSRCFLFAHLCLAPLPATSPSALLDSTGSGRLRQPIVRSTGWIWPQCGLRTLH